MILATLQTLSVVALWVERPVVYGLITRHPIFIRAAKATEMRLVG